MDNRKAKATFETAGLGPVDSHYDNFGRAPAESVEFELPGLESLGNDRFRLNGVKLVNFDGVTNPERLRELLGGEEADYATEHFYRWLESRQLARVLAERIRGR